MLDTLIQVGKTASLGKDEWDPLIYAPAMDSKSDKSYTYLIYYLIFDLDAATVSVQPAMAYDDKRAKEHFNLQVKGGNNMAYYLSVHLPKHFEQLVKTLFGKTGDKKNLKGELFDLMERMGDKDTQVALLLKEIFQLKAAFEAYLPQGVKSNPLKLEGSERIHLLVTAVRWAAQSIPEVMPLCHLDGYQAFLQKTLFSKPEAQSESKLCYATGLYKTDVVALDLAPRYSLNKMFVETTRNYASHFEKNHFAQNYQVSLEQQVFLEAGSKKILERSFKIAAIDHCILAQFSTLTPQTQILDLDDIEKITDILFAQQWLTDAKNEIDKIQRRSKNPLCWWTLLGFESDGNFFKTINIIQDVNYQYITELIECFDDVQEQMRTLEGAQWMDIITIGKEKKTMWFNFLTLYNIIPVRKDKEKKNVALSLFKAILERQPIDESIVYQHFKDLILCHRFHRYKAYTNIYPMEDYFDFAARNAAFQYLALIQLLKKLNLFKSKKMTAENLSPLVASTDAQITAFFDKMEYNPAQKALFYLGRILSRAAYAQVEKKHKSKPILNKVNFNGLALTDIQKLSGALWEKAHEYEFHGTQEFLMNQFTQHFEPNNWKMGREEALFYLLLGYSFRVENVNKTE